MCSWRRAGGGVDLTRVSWLHGLLGGGAEMGEGLSGFVFPMYEL